MGNINFYFFTILPNQKDFTDLKLFKWFFKRYFFPFFLKRRWKCKKIKGDLGVFWRRRIHGRMDEKPNKSSDRGSWKCHTFSSEFWELEKHRKQMWELLASLSARYQITFSLWEQFSQNWLRSGLNESRLLELRWWSGVRLASLPPGPDLFRLPTSTSIIPPDQDLLGQRKPQGQSSGNN